jgi:hypothetical protein
MSSRAVTVLVTFLLVIVGTEGAVLSVSHSLPDPAPWPSNETEIKAEQLELGNDYSIVFVGTSVTEAAVDPEIVTDQLGSETYNAATPFASQESLWIWVEQFVFPNADPEVLVVGVPLWSSEFAESATGGVLVTGLRQVERFRDPTSSLARLAQNSALLHWRTELKSIADRLAPANQLGSMGLWTDRGHQTGYYERTVPDIGMEVGVNPSEASLDFTPLIGLVHVAMARGAQVILLAEPASCDPHGRCLTADGVAILRTAYTRLAAELDVPFVEIEVSWPRAWYADAAHFNRRGTLEYTTRLVVAMQELGL